MTPEIIAIINIVSSIIWLTASVCWLAFSIVALRRERERERGND